MAGSAYTTLHYGFGDRTLPLLSPYLLSHLTRRPVSSERQRRTTPAMRPLHQHTAPRALGRPLLRAAAAPVAQPRPCAFVDDRAEAGVSGQPAEPLPERTEEQGEASSAPAFGAAPRPPASRRVVRKRPLLQQGKFTCKVGDVVVGKVVSANERGARVDLVDHPGVMGCVSRAVPGGASITAAQASVQRPGSLWQRSRGRAQVHASQPRAVRRAQGCGVQPVHSGRVWAERLHHCGHHALLSGAPVHSMPRCSLTHACAHLAAGSAAHRTPHPHSLANYAVLPAARTRGSRQRCLARLPRSF